MPIIPRARSLSRTRFPRKGRDAFPTSFGLGRPPLRAVSAKLARNNRSAAPPYRKTGGFAFAPPAARGIPTARRSRSERSAANEAWPVTEGARER